MNNGKRVKILKAEVSSTLEKNEYDFKKIGECSNNLVVKCVKIFCRYRNYK